MCIIIVKPKKAGWIPFEHLENSYNYNNDWVGFVASNGFDCYVNKYDNFNDFYNDFAMYNNDDYAIMLHFRLATHWAKNDTNTHPYPLSDMLSDYENRTHWKGKRFVHNWVLHDYWYNTKYSDSIMFWKDYLFDNENKKQIENELKSSKIVVMDNDKFTIYNKHLWTVDNGIWYSNDCYLLYDDYDYYDSFTDFYIDDFETVENIDTGQTYLLPKGKYRII